MVRTRYGFAAGWWTWQACVCPWTFCFADLTGFTNYTAEHGDDVAATLLSAFRAVAQQHELNQ